MASTRHNPPAGILGPGLTGPQLTGPPAPPGPVE
jgi:hypothetical protein